MSYWTDIHGTIVVSLFGRTQAEKKYILDTVLDHLPVVSGSENNMEVYSIQKRGYNMGSSHNEFNEWMGDKNCDNLSTQMQEKYILVVDGALRDRMFEETYKAFQKWICRLAKRIQVENVMVEIAGYEKKALVRNDNDVYGNMFEWYSWCDNGEHKDWRLNDKLEKYHPDTEFKEPNWTEYLMYNTAKRSVYPMLLKYKYFNDPENDAEVERRMKYGMF